jgi:signal transduction histidine kinase
MNGAIARSVAAWTVAALLATIGAPPAAATHPSDVLVLYSNGRLLPANVEGDRGLHQTIQAPADRPVTLFYEFLDAPRFGGAAYDSIVADYLRGKYASRQPRVIVAVREEALAFLLRHRGDLFPRVPVVHAGIDRRLLTSLAPLPTDVVGAPAEYAFSPTIDLALRWHPGAGRLVVVTGAAAPDRAMEAQLRQELVAFTGRAEVEILAGLPMRDVLTSLGELGRNAVVFTPGMFRDGEGRDFTPQQSVEAMAAASGAPVYGPFSTLIGSGIVGGYMPSFEEMGRQAGQIVNELLAGTEPASLRLPDAVPQILNVDWRQLRRWGIKEREIPADAVMHFKPPTLLEAYHNEVIAAAAVFVLQAGLIGWLLAERRRRRLSEQTEETQRHELAHASRLAVAGELTGSIAHEISQPLGAILSNADAAELILSSGGDRRDELRGILADIRRDDLRASEVIRRLRALLSKNVLERQPFDLNDALREIEPVLRAELRRRRVALEMRTAAAPLIILGDRIETQQVLINLVLNSMDAMTDVPEQQRAVVISISGGADTAAVEVRDFGHGIPPENLSKLFDPFFTTKQGGMGLGLSIARTMVEAHGGRIRAENAPGGGAVFRVELPTAGTRE